MASYLVFALGPVLLFAFIDFFSKNLRYSILGAIAGALIELGWLFSATGRLDAISLLAVVLLLILGYVSLRTENRLYFKLQPAIVTVLIGTALGYMQLVGPPILDRYWPILEPNLTADQRAMLLDPGSRRPLNQVMTLFVPVIFINAAWIAYAAYRQSQRAWVLANVFGIFILCVPFGIFLLMYRLIIGPF